MKEILCGDIKKHVDMQCQDIKSYDDLRATIMKWAVAKRIEKDRRHEMDVGSVEVEAVVELSAGQDYPVALARGHEEGGC